MLLSPSPPPVLDRRQQNPPKMTSAGRWGSVGLALLGRAGGAPVFKNMPPYNNDNYVFFTLDQHHEGII
jgi:hypothetical protein